MFTLFSVTKWITDDDQRMVTITVGFPSNASCPIGYRMYKYTLNAEACHNICPELLSLNNLDIVEAGVKLNIVSLGKQIIEMSIQ